MYGLVTRNESELSWSTFDRGFYEVKAVSGREQSPVTNGVNMVACHGDTAASGTPGLVPVNADGEEATRDRSYFDWGYVCPTHTAYRDGLLKLISECAASNSDVRLDDIGFPRGEYCFCNRCVERFESSGYDDWYEWRSAVVTAFVRAASERVPGNLYLTLYPDPFPGHLKRRTGVDPEAISRYVDEFVVPLYDMVYSTTYWLEILAMGFVDVLSTPFSIELYAVDVDLDNLIHAAEVASAYTDNVYFGYDASTAQAAVRRIEAADAHGATYGDPA